MKGVFGYIVALALILTACSSQAMSPTATPVSAPTSAMSTAAPTPTPFIPTIDVDGVQVPDPKVTNPELFDLKNPDSPIVQFANAFGVKPEDVVVGLHPEILASNGKSVVLRTPDGVALMLAQQDRLTKKWQWTSATPGRYWYAQGKTVGVYMDYGANTGDRFNYDKSLSIISKFYSNGILALDGQVRPNAGRTPDKASNLARFTQQNDMSLDFFYVAEPGKFPDDIHASNVDTWIDGRFDGIINLLKNYKTEGHPMHITFNEAWEGSRWNTDDNPLRDKYADKWVRQYIYQLLFRFINAGLIPNKDFIINFCDANLWNHPDKQDLMFHTFSDARQDAFNRLVSDSIMKQKLDSIGIIKPEDIIVLTTVQTNTILGQYSDNGTYFPEPTADQINAMANKFATLGGIMVELNPHSKDLDKQHAFLNEVLSTVESNPNIRGQLFFNIFNPDDPTTAAYSTNIIPLFNEEGSPTFLLYDMLR